MDDSDEYFDDSFILDEAALASIQATEERFGASLSQARCSQPAPLLQASPSPPPPKRSRISHINGVARVPPQPLLRTESLELNPEIRVGPDGNYVVSTQSKALTQAARSNGGPSGLAARLPDSADIHTELASVRAQLAVVSASLSMTAIEFLLRQDKLNAENVAIQKSLREAQDAQLVKAGEVSILRQTIDKVCMCFIPVIGQLHLYV